MAYLNEVPDYTAEGSQLPADKLANGFQPGEKPPANWFNYLFNKICMAIKELQQKTYENTHIDEQLNTKFNKEDVVQTTGTETAKVMSQDAVTKKLSEKVDKTSIVQATGTSTTNVMSQKVVTDNINALIESIATKLNKSAVVQATGTSTANVMSQNAVTKAIDTAKKAAIAEIPTITIGTANPSGGSSGDIYIKYS